MRDPSLSPIQTRFAALNLSDCQLVGLRSVRGVAGEREAVCLDLMMVHGTEANMWRPATMVFLGCAALNVDFDFWAKEACGDTIDEGSCTGDAEVVVALLHEHHGVREGVQPLSTLTAFTINLCSPSGLVRVVARDFVISYADEGMTLGGNASVPPR